MKISIEFTSMRDLLTSLPKFVELIGGEGTPEERFAKALDEDCKSLNVKVTPTDGKPLTGEEVQNVKDAIVEGLAKTRLSESEASETPVSKPEQAQSKPEKEKTGESKGKVAKPENEAKSKTETAVPKEADVRKVFNALIQSGKRDKLKEILKSFGASNFSSLKPEHYAEAIKKAQAELGKED